MTSIFKLRLQTLTVVVYLTLIIGALPVLSADTIKVQTTNEDQSNIAITIYNDGTGLVKDVRWIDIPQGQFDLIYMDVAAAIDPTSVHLISLTDPAALGVLEQNYEYDLVSTAALYQKNIDNNVVVRTGDGKTISGKLLSYDGNLVIQTSSGIVIVNNPAEVSFDKLPEGLITRPTLRWSLTCKKPGKHETEMSYLTSGINWSANYVAVVGKNDDKLDLSGWVTINNTSGADYREAELKLVAGEVHRVRPQYRVYANMTGAEGGEEMAKGFREEAFFEYHLYTLQRPATVLDKQQKQISLLEGEGISAQKILVFDPGYTYYYAGDTSKDKIKVRLKFMNSEDNGLGIPIPKGIIRVFKKDSSGALQFVGEDEVDHTPKNEQIEIYLGEAFDIVGERVVMNRRQVSPSLWEYDIKVTIRNHKKDNIIVTYWDHVWGDWSVIRSSSEYSKKDASTLEFLIPVVSGGEKVLTYTIKRQG